MVLRYSKNAEIRDIRSFIPALRDVSPFHTSLFKTAICDHDCKFVCLSVVLHPNNLEGHIRVDIDLLQLTHWETRLPAPYLVSHSVTLS